ncbi:hypothetical protein COT97_01300 [Candidatus Falkowbacteria bacterium CG10_big_fil_rev_8_21_14_0_10_39_11]|uniref:Uncharacterized protein n=1 Tax=Candidatus Falkowbacteria bacterium CG10_big_fil_rev_8_21_14_0_10_39_11 TaxID=1974565 RepID=A0A2H0V5Y6_9BACT|nr:MAG: hypothetical protein COT97_01300 [Candidatus Falkowbacteria bacterium CG10_big_fil_rev_8_21_14_0_10_39_11]
MQWWHPVLWLVFFGFMVSRYIQDVKKRKASDWDKHPYFVWSIKVALAGVLIIIGMIIDALRKPFSTTFQEVGVVVWIVSGILIIFSLSKSFLLARSRTAEYLERIRFESSIYNLYLYFVTGLTLILTVVFMFITPDIAGWVVLNFIGILVCTISMTPNFDYWLETFFWQRYQRIDVR